MGDKNETKLGSYILSDLTNILLTRYKNHSLLVIKKELASSSSLCPLFVLLEFEFNPNIMPLVVESVSQPISYSLIFKTEPNDQIEWFIYQKIMINFALCLRNSSFYSLLTVLHNFFPMRGKNNLTPELFLDKIYLDTFINKAGLFMLGDSKKIHANAEWKNIKENFINYFAEELLVKSQISQEYYCKLVILLIAIFNRTAIS